MPDEVELTIPARAELLSLARMTAAAVATRAGFDYEEIEDLRLAIDELCSRLLQPEEREPTASAGTLALRYRWDAGELQVSCQLLGSVPAPTADAERDLSDRILEALVDAHGTGAADDGAEGVVTHCWLRKRRRASEMA